MELGQPKDLRDAAAAQYTRVKKVKNGENIHRVLFGPVRVERIWIPVLATDDDGKAKPSRRTIIRPPEGCLLDFAASMDRRLQSQKGQDKPRSVLDPKAGWTYLTIDRKDENYPVVDIFEYPYSVFKRITQEIETEKHTQDPNMLRHGLIWMFDLIITKKVSSGQSAMFGTSYSTEVDAYTNKMAGKIPLTWRDKPFAEILSELGDPIESGLFTPEEWKAIDECTLNLVEEGKPTSQTEIIELLQKTPLYLDSKTRDDGSPEFLEPDFLEAQFKEQGIPTAREAKTQVAGTGLPPSGPMAGQLPPAAQPNAEVAASTATVSTGPTEPAQQSVETQPVTQPPAQAATEEPATPTPVPPDTPEENPGKAAEDLISKARAAISATPTAVDETPQ